jgi:hypothetical protein
MKRALDTVSEQWLAERLEQAAPPVRAPRGFAQRVMSEVYREALAARAAPQKSAERSAAAATAAAAPSSRLYRRLALSFMITAAVLMVSLLVPRGAYPGLIGAAAGKALGPGPTSAVQTALTGAAVAVQGALGERVIGGGM